MLDFPKNRILSPKPVWTGSFSDYITAIAWHGESDNLAIATANGEVQICSPNCKQLKVLQSPTNESIDCLGFSGNWLGAAGQAGEVKLWDFSNSNEDPTVVSLGKSEFWIDFLAWQRSQVAFSLGKYVQVWSVETQYIVTTVNFENSSVQALAWHGDWLTVGGYQSIKIWNGLDWDQDPYILPLSTAITAIAWHKEGKYLAIATADDTVVFLDAKNGKFSPSPFQLSGFSNKIKAIAWADHTNSNIFALASGAEVTIWQPHPNPNNGWQAEVFNQDSGTVNVLEFQPRTKVLASGGADGKVRLSKGAIAVQIIDITSEITCLKWHPKGQRLAVGTGQGEVLIWDVLLKSSGSKGFWS